MQNSSYNDVNHVCRSVFTERLYIDITQKQKKKKKQNVSEFLNHVKTLE